MPLHPATLPRARATGPRPYGGSDGRAISSIAALALANLSEVVKTALDERRIKLGHAELLGTAVPGDKQDKALDTILKAALDVNKTRELLMRVTQHARRRALRQK